jgi:hypothetical protein
VTRFAFAALLAAFVASGSTLVLAQQGKPAVHRSRHPRPPADAGAVEPGQRETPMASRGNEPEQRAVDAGLVEAKTLDGGTRVFRFGEVEIEGRLRNPQLVYFLRRVRAEFAAGDLGHRSFMRELSDTRHDPSF